MTRDERRRIDRSKALSRIRRLIDRAPLLADEDFTLMKFTNNNYVNDTTWNHKTNRGKGHSTYKSKGAYHGYYGYTASDQRKIDSLDSSLHEEWSSEED